MHYDVQIWSHLWGTWGGGGGQRKNFWRGMCPQVPLVDVTVALGIYLNKILVMWYTIRETKTKNLIHNIALQCTICRFLVLSVTIYKISCVLRTLWLISYHVYIRLSKYGFNVTAYFSVLFYKINGRNCYVLVQTRDHSRSRYCLETRQTSKRL